MDFSQFYDKLEKHILMKESEIDFDEYFYIEANPELKKKLRQIVAMFITVFMENMREATRIACSFS
jgi:hypothetical protein